MFYCLNFIVIFFLDARPCVDFKNKFLKFSEKLQPFDIMTIYFSISIANIPFCWLYEPIGNELRFFFKRILYLLLIVLTFDFFFSNNLYISLVWFLLSAYNHV